MATPRKKTDPIRRSPRQERAVASLEAILSAATQILATKGRDGFTTNHIAERAGVSIGTLYQYFPDKVAILVALARRLLAEDRKAVLAAVAAAASRPGGELDRAAIREGIARYAVQPKARRIIMETLIGLGRLEEVSGPVQDVGALLVQQMDLGGLDGAARALRMFAATRGVEGAIRAAAYEGMPFFGTQAFEDALVLMARGLIPELTQGRASAAPSPA